MKLTSIVLICIFLSGLYPAYGQETAKPSSKSASEEMKEFSEGSYLQIDQLDVPKGIKRVEDQLRENVIDVILHSKTHVPIFAQKRPEGYSQNYKKFYGINIRILPILGDDDFYSLQLFYYNWTTNKFDKRLVKKISKYNVLNELRFATYEILLGKQWVVDHKDQIEARNFDRIQAVREVITEQEKRRKKQLKDDEKKKALEEEEAEKVRARNLMKREERVKNKKNELEESENPENEASKATKDAPDQVTIDSEIEKQVLEKNNEKEKSRQAAKKASKTSVVIAEEAAVIEQAAPPIPEASGPAIPKKSFLYGFANYFQEDVESLGLVQTSTSLKYLGAGGRFLLERQTEYPTGMRVSIQAASPIFKEKYKFPIYRGVESEVYISKLLNHFKIFGGLDFVPVYFVGLPSAGSRFQVFENDFLWGKIGIESKFLLFERAIELRASYLKSLVAKSNQEGDYSGSKMIMSGYSQISGNHGAEINFSTMKVDGTMAVSSTKIGLSYIYKFEN